MSVWIARDEDGTLGLYWSEPLREGDVFVPSPGSGYKPLDGELFPQVLPGCVCLACVVVEGVK